MYIGNKMYNEIKNLWQFYLWCVCLVCCVCALCVCLVYILYFIPGYWCNL